MIRATACILLLASCLSGCAVGPDYHRPETPLPVNFAGSSGAPSEPDLSQWWRTFGDAELNSLVERAIKANPDIEIALTRLQEARARQVEVAGAALPGIEASAAAGRGTGSDLSRAGAAPALRAGDNKGDLDAIRQVAGFAATWELDLAGGYRRALEAGRGDIQALAAARNAVLISVVADVARNYIDLRAMQMRRTILLHNLDSAQQLQQLQQARYDRGLTNELDLQLANRELSRLRSQLPPLDAQIEAAIGTLGELLDLYPQQLAPELTAAIDLPALPGKVEPGLPLDLLQRRPDVRQSERELAAATARIGVATADLFPHVALSGGLGTQAQTIGSTGSHIWAFGPSFYWPLLDFGALDAKINVADLQAHEHLLVYRKTVIIAVQEANKAIANFSAQQRRVDQLEMAMGASDRAVDLAQQRYDRGLTDFLNVVDAQRQQYALDADYIAARQSSADALIYLYKALGGGWEQYQSLPAIRRPEPAAVAAIHRLIARDNAAR